MSAGGSYRVQSVVLISCQHFDNVAQPPTFVHMVTLIKHLPLIPLLTIRSLPDRCVCRQVECPLAPQSLGDIIEAKRLKLSSAQVKSKLHAGSARPQKDPLSY